MKKIFLYGLTIACGAIFAYAVFMEFSSSIDELL
jgi:hypothetical protein